MPRNRSACRLLRLAVLHALGEVLCDGLPFPVNIVFVAAPFKRNDATLEALPIGFLVFPGTRIPANIADRLRSAAPGLETLRGG